MENTLDQYKVSVDTRKVASNTRTGKTKQNIIENEQNGPEL